jgi:hypothetical protein
MNTVYLKDVKRIKPYLKEKGYSVKSPIEVAVYKPMKNYKNYKEQVMVDSTTTAPVPTILISGLTYRCANGEIVTVEKFETDSSFCFRPMTLPAYPHPFPRRSYEGETWDQYGNSKSFAVLQHYINPKDEVIPKVDLRDCKGGEELISKHGYHCIYVGINESEAFPHLILYPDGSNGTRNDAGKVFNKKSLPEDHDIVEVRGILPHKILNPPEPKIVL